MSNCRASECLLSFCRRERGLVLRSESRAAPQRGGTPHTDSGHSQCWSRSSNRAARDGESKDTGLPFTIVMLRARSGQRASTRRNEWRRDFRASQGFVEILVGALCCFLNSCKTSILSYRAYSGPWWRPAGRDNWLLDSSMRALCKRQERIQSPKSTRPFRKKTCAGCLTHPRELWQITRSNSSHQTRMDGSSSQHTDGATLACLWSIAKVRPMHQTGCSNRTRNAFRRVA